jgi:D-3-phosphoglycerate dehydrogenase
MAKKKLLIADKLPRRTTNILEAAGVKVDDRSGIEADELAKIIKNYDGLIVRSRTDVTAKLISTGKKLKVIGRAGVGVDNINLRAAKKQGIAVVNTPKSTVLAVAEHTLALMLALQHKVSEADASMKAGEWAKKKMRASELAGKTLGIVGMGHIGTLVAKRAAAFDMKVIGNDPGLDDETMLERGAIAVSLEELYSKAHIITFHIPLNNRTRGMINKKSFASMKNGVRIIQVARGGVIDEDALLTALESGKVAGAALDVYAEEPPGASPLVTHPKVVTTPHIAAQTFEAQRRAAKDIADEVLAALEDRPLRWQVA